MCTRIGGFRLIAVLITSLALLAIGCDSMGKDKDKSSMSKSSASGASGMQAGGGNMANKVAVAQVKPSQAATTQPVNNNVSGTVTFTQTAPDTVVVMVDLTGFEPNSKHGFHIHDKGDLSARDLSSAGGHFNPAGHKHGGPDSTMSHAGDLGNITANADGNVKTEITAHGIALDKSNMGIIGRSVIVHAKEDDLKTDPAGNSGARVAGGVIELKS
jgi:Cu-Zn family superoxide dismutase